MNHECTRRSLLQLLGIGSASLGLPLNADAVVSNVNVDAEAHGDTSCTRLELFLKCRGIKPAHLARESGYSRQHLLRVRLGRMQASLVCIGNIVVALRRLTRERLRPEHLFEAPAIRAAWRDTRLAELQDEDREDIRAAFGRRTLRELLGARA